MEPHDVPPIPDAGDAFAPKYHRLKRLLREQLAGMQPGALLPSEAELCQAYGVSRTTVRKAFGDLMQEGLIYTVQGKGTFVAPQKLRSGWVQQTGGMFADLTERGFHVTQRVLALNVGPAEEAVCAELHLAQGEPVIRLVRLRTVDGRPFDVVTNFLPAARFPGLEREDFSSGSLYALLRDRYHVSFGRGIRLVEAGACPPGEAALLQVAPATPILIMHSTMYEGDGRPVEHGIVHQRSDVAQIVIDVIPH